MSTIVAHYLPTDIKETFHNGPTAARSILLAQGFIIPLDRDGYMLQNPTTGEIVTLTKAS